MIPKTSPHDSRSPYVELDEEEFHSIYESVYQTILSELLPQDKILPEGSSLTQKCHYLLSSEENQSKKHIFLKGFLPLYERLYKARRMRPPTGNLYQIDFA